jgi:hypothetical protein
MGEERWNFSVRKISPKAPKRQDILDKRSLGWISGKF